MLTTWGAFRTADWAELTIDPDTMLRESQQLLAIAN